MRNSKEILVKIPLTHIWQQYASIILNIAFFFLVHFLSVKCWLCLSFFHIYNKWFPVSTKHTFSFLLTFVISNALFNFINRPIFIDWLSSYIFNHVKSNHCEILNSIILKILMKSIDFNCISFCKSNFPLDVMKSNDHKNAECHCLEALDSFMDKQKGVLGICYSEKSKQSTKNVFFGVLIWWCQRPFVKSQSILI